jgi:hypothetical protein
VREGSARAAMRERVRRSNRLAVRRNESLSVSVLCECGRACKTWLMVDADLYWRAGSRHRYVVAPGHHLPGADKVVLEKRDYDVIEAAA